VPAERGAEAVEENGMAKVTIDGRTIDVEEGTYVLKAAEELGIRIPTLCHHWALEPYAVCRICSVEARRGKRTRIVTACNYPCFDGIEVFTNTDRIVEYRKTLIELMLARHSKVQVIRDLAQEYAVDLQRFEEMPSESCILCGLCVRMCDEVVGARAISFAQRGVDREVVTPFADQSDACIGCGACAYVCPTAHIRIEDVRDRQIVHSDLELGPGTPIYVKTMQSVPNAPVIDYDSCIHFKTGECKICERVCEPDAINHEMEDTTEEVEVGTVIVATGYESFDANRAPEYGYGRLNNVITSVEFEKLCNASGPTGGRIKLADGSAPESVAILHCIGSRDENYNEYCSRVCCMAAMKFAHLVKEKVECPVYEFYIDIRAFGKGYEEFYKRMMDEDVLFIRGKGAEVTDFAETPEEEGKLIVRCEDTLLGIPRRVPVDMVVLMTALEPRRDAAEVGRTMGIGCTTGGFFLELHPKLAPVATASDGVFLAGCCQGPKDIPDTVAQGAAAACGALSLIDQGSVELEPIVSVIDEDTCAGCKVCLSLCPYTAITFDEEKKISVVNDALCKGCGTCVSACPSGAARQQGFTDRQIFAEIEGALAPVR
jgi:heterodisulfide reductase subunit A